jgi:uncharacterized protein YigA (DUF484 family)
MNPITEEDIANYLINTPDFFERHAEVLASVQVRSPHGQRAVSLQERQAEMLRDKIKNLEGRIMDMIRHSGENAIIADKLQRWAMGLLRESLPSHLPRCVVDEVRDQFMVPQVAIKLWGVSGEYQAESFAQGVSDEVKALADSLQHPFCGAHPGTDAVNWLPDPQAAVSVALLPLRSGQTVFGLLVLASPDPQRFHSGMGTDFLERMAALASAALARLQTQGD